MKKDNLVSRQPYLLQPRETEFLKKELLKFNYNSSFFEALLNEGAKYTLPNEGRSLIPLFSNPYCQPYSKAHIVLDDWLEKRDNIKLQVIFAIDGSQAIALDLSLQVHCKAADITGMPTIFINGRRLPKNYQPEDIKYLI